MLKGWTCRSEVCVVERVVAWRALKGPVERTVELEEGVQHTSQ